MIRIPRSPFDRRITTSVTFKCAAWLFLLMFVLAADIPADTTGLLFHLSGDNGLVADVANGGAEPTFIRGVDVIPDGAVGKAFRCEHTQLMAYDAPGNVYAERGTLSFYWRSREPVGEAPFPVFRVSYSDHSSWDLVWLRIDYNGNRGFDAFVTDANLARPRISHSMTRFPGPEEWIHLALSWDETIGIRFYVNGELAGKKDTTAVFYAGLDQFGPHSRIISPYQVQSLYNYIRGGDIDEVCIFDRMLTGEQVARLSRGEIPANLPPLVRRLSDPAVRDEWLLRYGWNRPDDIPPLLDAPSTTIRKVEIHDVYDLKQWIWKGTDGIRETTWPYVYNRSRIPGRQDYFILPDWNCYSLSGKAVTFFMPDEPWNHLEISGAAYGIGSLLSFDRESESDEVIPLFTRPRHQERTFHRFDRSFAGGKIRFENVAQETPIGEFQAYHVSPGMEPDGKVKLSYTLRSDTRPHSPTLDELVRYIDGRFLPDERTLMVALPGGAPRFSEDRTPDNALPLVHVLIPFEFRAGNLDRRYTRYSYTWENMDGGLDGIAIDLPALDVQPTHGDLFPMNIRVMDPLWPDRVMLDFTFSVRPGEARTLWLDTRDRVLPNGRSLYLTIAGAGGDFGADDLDGTRLRLVFKERDAAVPEQEIDRFTQVRDNLGNMVEEHPNIKKLRMYDRYSRDIEDLLRVNPKHEQGRYYWSARNSEQGWPAFDQPEPPAGVPLWAFRQVENLGLVREFVEWWIDERQIENGEFGGGLSDDGDMTNQFPGPALMGVIPEKITGSVLREMEAFYENGTFTDGLPTIVTDELHVYEEGINVLPQTMLLDYGDPKVIERLMVTAKAYERITGINDLGQRQVKSTFYGGPKIYSEGVWAKSLTSYSHLVFHPGFSLVEFNGHPAAKKLMLEICDGILEHRKQDSNGNYYLPAEILFPSGEDRGRTLGMMAHMMWGAYRWTGDGKYLLPIRDEVGRGAYGVVGALCANVIDLLGERDTWGRAIASRTSPRDGNAFSRHLAWQVTGDKQYLEELYADQIQRAAQSMYMNTEGHWWIDRVYAESRELQRARLGGVALWRNMLYPGHVVSWRFEKPARGESVAILVPDATTTAMTVIVYNIEKEPVEAHMTAWDIEPGKWRVVEGIDTDGDDRADGNVTKRTVEFERTKSLAFTFPPRATTVITLKRTSKGKPYWQRPDLGIGDDDVTVARDAVRVTVHSLGSVDAPASTVAIVDQSGAVLARADVPPLKAPIDYEPKTAEVTLTVKADTLLRGCLVVVDPDGKLQEITKINNTVDLP